MSPLLAYARRSRRIAAAVTLTVLALAGCARYAPAPLTPAPVLAADSAGPMTVAQVTARVLRDDPDLAAARAQRGVGRAQLLQAGLLPDPSFNGAILPLAAGVGTGFAWNAGLTEDVRALVTLSARKAGAREAARQVDAQLLWQEWQATGQARLLAVRIIGGERALRLLREAREVFADRSRRLDRALAQGNVTLTTAAPDSAALQSARAAVDAAERQQLVSRHALNALMGREPDASLVLVDAPDLPPLDPSQADALSRDLTLRRPDLIALRLGYRSQEARTRLAILNQYPALVFGVTGGSDNSDVRNVGPTFSFSLPIFDRGRGDIALQRATREQLRAEYAARLNAAYGQLRAAVTELASAQAQLNAARADLPGVTAAAAKARTALGQGALDELGYVDLISARLTKAQEIVTLEQAVLEQDVAILTLTGAGLPAMTQGE